MGRIGTDRLRNVALVGHGGSGKTSLAEAMLFFAGVTSRQGRVEEGNTVTDYDPEEIKRHVSISVAFAPFEWNGYKLNILDTPGYFDFVGEVVSSLRVADAGMVVLDAVGGVEVGTEKVVGFLDGGELPRLYYINKMDRENANFDKVVESIRAHFGTQAIPVQVPIGSADKFRGVVDIIAMKAYLYEGRKATEAPIPDELKSEVEGYREQLSEAVAVTDDELTMKFLDGEPLTEEEVAKGLVIGTASGKIHPIMCGSAAKGIGLDLLISAMGRLLPSPSARGSVFGANPQSGAEETRTVTEDGPLSALVFKTMADPYVGKLTLFKVYSGVLKSDSHVFNAVRQKEERIGQLFMPRGKEQIPVAEVVAGDIGAVAKLAETSTNDTLCAKDKPIKLAPISFPRPSLTLAVVPKAKGDEDKISGGMTRLTEEDPTFTVEKSTSTNEMLVSGQGDLHLEIIASRLRNKFGVEVEMHDPKVPYRETIRGTVKVEGKHKKQTGGRGQYGHVWLELQPLAPGGGFEFVDKIFGGAVPRQFIPAVEKGVRETLEDGALAGYPVVDVRVILYDGSYHAVDSSEMAFKIAASMAFKKGFMDAKPVLLEPIYTMEVTVPDQYMGDIIGDLNKKRGRILGMEPGDGVQKINAQVPLAEVFKYAVDLRSITQGRGSFTMKFDRYEEVPANTAEQIIAQAKAEKAV